MAWGRTLLLVVVLLVVDDSLVGVSWTLVGVETGGSVAVIVS